MIDSTHDPTRHTVSVIVTSPAGAPVTHTFSCPEALEYFVQRMQVNKLVVWGERPTMPEEN